MTGGHIFSIQVRLETFHTTEGVGLTSATAVMGQPLGWNTQSAHWSKAKFNKSWEEEMKTSIVPAWKHKGNLGVEWNQAMWNFTSMRGIKSLALEKRVFKCDDTSLRRYLQDNVFAVAPFPQGSHANSLEATESPLPALEDAVLLTRQSSMDLPVRLPTPLVCCGELLAATCHAMAPKDFSSG